MELYASHWRDPETTPCPHALDARVDDTPGSIAAHRCQEQLCYAAGSCLMPPCDSLRPQPRVGSLPWSAEPCGAPGAALACAYLDLETYRLRYRALPEGVNNCWDGLLGSAEDYRALRVWEQLGFSPRPELLIARYDAAAQATLP